MFIISLFAAIAIAAFYIIVLSFMAWMIVSAAKHDQFWWIVLQLALPLVGSLIYYFTEKAHLYKKIETPKQAEHHQA